MKKKIVRVTLITASIMGAFFVGKSQAKTETVEIVPDGYIKLTEAIPLEDISCKFIDEYDYICLELGDCGNQFDDPTQASYEDILSDIEDITASTVSISRYIDCESFETFYTTEDGNELHIIANNRNEYVFTK